VSRTSPPATRSPRPQRTLAPPRPPRPSPPAPADLQLAITRTGIGLELTAPLPLACVTVSELSASLPGLRFPLDVSGGVTRFRHRRGVVERLVLEVGRTSLESWAATRLRGVIGLSTPKVSLFVRRGGATVGILDAEAGVGLAFEVEMDAIGDAIALSLHDARAAGPLGPPTALAVRAVQAVTGHAAERHGARFVFHHIAAEVARSAFPDRGARAPGAEGLGWSALRGEEDAWRLVAERGEASCEPTAMAVLAREGCALAERADDAAFALDLEAARGLLVDALERAPRHRELSRRLAEIDHALGAQRSGRSARAEAALATMRDAERAPSSGDGLLLARLLEETGDVTGAVATFSRAGEGEPVGALAALAYEAAARLTRDPYDALALLDHAVARAPALPGPRWARLTLRLAVGRVDDARADAEHLEALSAGARARHAVWRRAGQAFLGAGHQANAAALFERALRYNPRDAEATAGLGAALVAAGKVARGAELLTLAVTLAEGARTEAWGAHLGLGRVLAERLDDRPAAIARVHAVPAHAAEALLARGLEGRWRAELGDLAGASLAYARARDLAEARLVDLDAEVQRDAVAILLEAARLESDVKGDWLAAQRHLGAALRLAPHDAAARSAFREAGLQVAGLAVAAREPELEPDSAPTVAGVVALQDEPVDEAVDHARVEELTRKVQADPTDDRVVDELAAALLRLGRLHELFALLSARIDEATPARREALVPRQREALRRLEEEARTAGRSDEASLYRETREQL